MADKAKKKSAKREWVESIIIAGVLAVILRTFFFQLYKIPTTSMVPTLKPRDKIFVSRIHYGPKIPFTQIRLPGFTRPKRGDVVVFIPPHERKKAYVKRLIGLEGEAIVLKDGNVYVNAEEVVDPRIAQNRYSNQGKHGKRGEEIVVPEGKYFFLGDNSNSSMDSRYWGFVDKEDIVGRAIFIWWPPNRIDMIE